MNAAVFKGLDAEHLRELFGRAPCVLWTMDSERRFIFVSPAIEQVTGFTVDDCCPEGARLLRDFAHPDDGPRLIAALDALITRGQPFDLECRGHRKSGESIWVRVRANSAYELDGRRFACGLLSDITESKRKDAAMRDSDERLRLALAAARVGIYDWDVPGAHIIWSAWHEKLWGFAPGEFDGSYQAFMSRVHPDDVAGIEAEVARSLAARDQYAQEFRVLWPDGSVHWIAASGEFEFDDAGQPMRMRGVVLDVTEHKQSEADQRDFAARMRRLYESIRDAYAAVGMDGRFTEVNETFASMLGYEEAELIGRAYADITPERWRAAGDRVLHEQVLIRGYSDVFEKEYQRKDGSVFPVELRSFLQRDAAGTPTGMWAIVRDITQRKREVAELRESKERFRMAFDCSPALMSIARLADGRYLEVNGALEMCTGYSRDEIVGRTRSEVGLWASATELQLATRAIQERGGFEPMRAECRCKHGKVRILRISGVVVQLAGERCLLSVAEDVTELERAESRIRELNVGLELRVRERTEELGNLNQVLQARSDELASFNRAMIGREKRVIELKEEVNQLCARLKLPPAYAPVWREG
jgi:PAS domain S-box-containing protein